MPPNRSQTSLPHAGIALHCITTEASLAAAQTDGNPPRFNATAMCNDTHSSSQRQVAGPFTLIHMNVMACIAHSNATHQHF